MVTRGQVTTPWLTVEECALYMHKRVNKVQQWVRSGKLKSRAEPGSERGVLIHVSDADEMIKSWPSGSKLPSSMRKAAEVT